MTITQELIPFNGMPREFPQGRFLALTNAGLEIVINNPISHRHGVVWAENAWGEKDHSICQSNIKAYMPIDDLTETMKEALKEEVAA